MTIKNGDFVEIEYTGKTKEDAFIFDTTDKTIAKENNIFNQNTVYGPIVIVIGEKHVIKGMDTELVNKEVEKSYSFNISSENAFGKRNAKLLQLIPTNRFTKEEIRPMPGLQVNVDGKFGIVRNVSGGRTIVDFNHPLSGKDVTYEVKVNKIINDTKEKISSLLSIKMSIKKDEINVIVNDSKAKIMLPIELPDQIKEKMKSEVTRLIQEIKELKFEKKEKIPNENKEPKK